MKKLTSILLVLAMILTFGFSAMAATIEITNGIEDQTYSAYKIFDVSVSGDNYAYTINSTSEWYSVVAAYTGDLTLTQIGLTGVYTVVAEDDFDAADFAAYLDESKDGKTVAASGVANADGEITLTVADAGYYFVDSSLGALCSLLTSDVAVSIIEKNSPPTIDKTVEDAKWVTKTIGDIVEFEISIIAGGAADTSYILHDTMSAGLTLDTDSFVITDKNGEVAAGNFKIDIPGAGTATFSITFAQSYTATLDAGDEISVVYEAMLNGSAETGLDAETNTAWLDYGNSSTPETKVEVFTYEFDIVKTDGENNILEGAEFKLYDALTGGNEIVLTLDEDGFYRPALDGETAADIEAGVATIKGLAVGTYYLEETVAPDGFNKLTSRIEVVVTANNSATVDRSTYVSGGVEVINTAGVLLPGTGGMGTVLFGLLGSAIMIGATAVLFTNKKRVFGK